ncbi:hypothetical protein QAD02_020130 [Eretmocerus hayati]|uniref:Uncharacterized protein n=1 Tax=Eretmocerus hayati TaxID=131215 RepID=A0ACC2PLM0_9HYME|nr:hypothetical protein QAD02_020130 [Eretmocerus hayati]
MTIKFRLRFIYFTDNVGRSRGSSREMQPNINHTRQGKGLLDWFNLDFEQDADPYIAKTNQACLRGDLAECFKSRALDAFSEFFDQSQYSLNDNIRVVRMPSNVLREVRREPFEFVSAARSSDSEWDQLMKFALRKAERFVKTVAFEVTVPSWVPNGNDVYSPRFLDEVADEIDVLEDKKDSLFSRNRLKRLFIPMLIVLKLFKLKLLLFLPIILGLVSFKKFLGFLAILIPGLIGFLKLYKPVAQTYTPPIYSQSGVGYPHDHYQEPSGFSPSHGQYHGGHHGEPINYAQGLAYQGYRNQ